MRKIIFRIKTYLQNEVLIILDCEDLFFVTAVVPRSKGSEGTQIHRRSMLESMPRSREVRGQKSRDIAS